MRQVMYISNVSICCLRKIETQESAHFASNLLSKSVAVSLRVQNSFLVNFLPNILVKFERSRAFNRA